MCGFAGPMSRLMSQVQPRLRLKIFNGGSYQRGEVEADLGEEAVGEAYRYCIR